MFIYLITNLCIAQEQHKLIVYFSFNDSELNNKAASRIDSTLLKIKNIKDITKVEISGHCDSVGGDSANNILSQKRVIEVKKYLIKKGIEEKFISKYIGYGKKKPLNKNLTEEERTLNRRVEIVLYCKKEIPKKENLSEQVNNTKVGGKLVLNNILFYPGSHELLPASKDYIVVLFKILKNNPKLKIEIQGHICCLVGTGDGMDGATGKFDLSTKRAEAVYKCLVNSGIDSTRLSYKGYGHQYPLFPETTEENKKKNRRVEIKIIEK